MRRGGILGLLLAAVPLIAAPQTPSTNGQTARLPLPALASSVALGGNRAAAVCPDKKLRIWDLTERRLLRVIELSSGSVDYTAISPDGHLIFTGEHSGNAVIWNSETGQAQLQMYLPHYPSTAAFSGDGKLLAIAPMGDPVQVFDVHDWHKLYQTNPVTGGTAAIAFSRDGKSMATADADTAVRIYDARNGKILAKNDDFLLEPLAVAFTFDGRQVIAAGADKVLDYVDASSGRLLRRLQKTAEPVAYLEVSPDGAYVATVYIKADNLVLPAPVAVWEVSTGQKVQDWMPPGLALATAWTHDGHLISAYATADSLQVVRIR